MSLLGAAPLVAFIATTDIVRARAFYQDILRLTLVEDSQWACVFQAGGTTLRVTPVQQAVVAPYTVLGWTVADIAETVRGLTGRGVVFERYPGMMVQDDLGIWTTPGGDQVAWFKDPDGHTLSLTQHTAPG